MKLRKWSNTFLSSLALLAGLPAAATPVNFDDIPKATLLVSASGKLQGAIGVPVFDYQLVDWVLYDVMFVEGTCTSVFSGCQQSAFAFTTESAALDGASYSLLGTGHVLTDFPGLGLFDSDASLTEGCSTATCEVYTPFAVSGGQVATRFARNYSGSNTDSLGGPGPEFIAVDFDTTLDASRVWAVWSNRRGTGLPEPSTFALIGAAACALLWFRRRRDALRA